MTEEEIFDAAIQLASREERVKFLDDACAGDVGLRSAVDDLLWAFDHPDSLFDIPTASLAGSPGPAEISSMAGQMIGRYRLEKEIGEGGFGVVYLAEQQEPVRRHVALKIVKPGMDTREVIARFEAERQALALMDHPSIARVFDGGATDCGHPYFVMELVQGEPLTYYCDGHRLNIQERMELFLQVCHAVQHAHTKGDYSPRPQAVAHARGTPRWCDAPEDHRFRDCQGDEGSAHGTDFRDSPWADHRHPLVHESRAGRAERGRCGHAAISTRSA